MIPALPSDREPDSAAALIRHESFGLESYSPYQDRDLRDYRIMDSGDLELSFGNTKLALADIEERAGIILNDGKIPFMLGGEHLVTLGAFRAAIKKFPDIHVIHFDAHADLRQDYLGAELSHACVLRRCWSWQETDVSISLVSALETGKNFTGEKTM